LWLSSQSRFQIIAPCFFIGHARPPLGYITW
jgi:hypothetical protein